MNEQRFEHIQEYYIKDLAQGVENMISEMNALDYVLADIKYANLEKYDGLCHAFMLFNPFENHSPIESLENLDKSLDEISTELNKIYNELIHYHDRMLLK